MKWRWGRKNSTHGYAINPSRSRNHKSFIDWNYFLVRSSSYFSACRFFHSTLSIIRISWRRDSREILQNQLRVVPTCSIAGNFALIFVCFPASEIREALSLDRINPGNSSNCISVPRTSVIISRDRVKRKILIPPWLKLLLFFEAA